MEFSMFDITLLTWLHNHLIPRSVPVLQFISDTTTYVSLAMALMVGISSLLKKSRVLLMQFFILVAVLLIVLVVTQGLKGLIDRDRPFTTYPDIEKLSSGGDSSFPSGHTLEAFAMAAAISLLFAGKKIFIPVYLWAILVAYSRMALGVHYPSDVLAGIMIGTFIGWIVPKGFRRTGIVEMRKPHPE
ncbi:MAG: phosphatase PAP2 family protein [Bacteroidetes bacterium]|nr:phosphatase PAP2 family protein [Bacteroidota bacterium]